MSKVTKAVVNVDADENTLGSNYQQILTKHRPISPLFSPLIYTCYLQNLSLTLSRLLNGLVEPAYQSQPFNQRADTVEQDQSSFIHSQHDLWVLKGMTKGLGCLRDKHNRMQKMQVKCINQTQAEIKSKGQQQQVDEPTKSKYYCQEQQRETLFERCSDILYCKV